MTMTGVAVVTGAASGMGREVALILGARGATVAAADADGAGTEAVAGEIVAAGGRASAYMLDVTDPAAVERTIERMSQELGRIAYLANLAGVYGADPFEDISDADWDRVMRVNAYGTFYVSRSVVRRMEVHGGGSIVNMSSLHAVRGQAGAAHYAASKGAVIGLTKSLALEKAKAGIRANAVAPGPIDTPMWRGSISGAELEEAKRRRAEVIPLGRLGQPREVAGVIAFLLGPESSYVTGHILDVNGGEAT